MDPIKEAADKIQQVINSLNSLTIPATPENVKTMMFAFVRLGEIGTILNSIVKEPEEENQNGSED